MAKLLEKLNLIIAHQLWVPTERVSAPDKVTREEMLRIFPNELRYSQLSDKK